MNGELPSSRLEKPSHQHHDGDRRPRRGDDRFQLVEALLGRVVGLERGGTLHLGDDGMQHAVGMVHRTLEKQARVPLAGECQRPINKLQIMPRCLGNRKNVL
jgi:hypothetical protein